MQGSMLISYKMQTTTTEDPISNITKEQSDAVHSTDLLVQTELIIWWTM